MSTTSVIGCMWDGTNNVNRASRRIDQYVSAIQLVLPRNDITFFFQYLKRNVNF